MSAQRFAKVGFNMQFMKKDHYETAPKQGVYVRGLFFEGGRWDPDAQLLVDCKDSEMVSAAPIILLRPAPREDVAIYPYECPVYRTSERRGQLSTTGLSTNFVMLVRVPTKKSQSFWKQRGTALLCALSD